MPMSPARPQLLSLLGCTLSLPEASFSQSGALTLPPENDTLGRLAGSRALPEEPLQAGGPPPRPSRAVSPDAHNDRDLCRGEDRDPVILRREQVAADLAMPQIPGPAVQPGATAPVTLAGALAQLVAEGLMALTLVQLRRRGAPCFLGGNLAVFDMATTSMSVAAPEMSLGIAAQAEVARHFGLPTWGLADSTDAKTLDAQAGLESTFSILAQGLAGLNLIHDVGYMDIAMVCSAEMLVLGDEVIGMAKRFIRGIEVNPETLARSVIEKVGPGGNYLLEEHTVRHFRQELWRPGLLTRQPYARWQEDGAGDITQRVRAKVRRIAEEHQAQPLPGARLAALERPRRQADADLAGG